MLKTALLVILALFSGWLYRRGGSDKTWHGKERDWGVSICTILCIVLYNLFSKQLTIVLNLRTLVIFTAVFLTSWGALSTYWKGDLPDCKWYHWFLHGFGVGLACLPLYAIGVHWWLIVARAVVLGATMTAVSEYSDNVVVEEGGRGGLIILTLPILF